MKASNFRHGKFFLLRTPTFAISDLIELNNIQNGIVFKEHLLSFFRTKFASEALYIASPILHNELSKYLEGSKVFKHSEESKLIKSLYKYYIRCHSRSIPFGLFAGFCMGKIAKELHSSIILESKEKFQRKVRFDTEVYFKLSDRLLQIDNIKQQLKFYPNTSIYIFNDQIRYAEKVITEGKRSYLLTKIDYESYLIEVLNLCRSGTTYSDLVEYLVTRYNAGYDDAKNYIDELIGSQVIISEIAPNVTGMPYLDRLSLILSNLPNTLDVEPLKATVSKLIDATNLAQDFSINVELKHLTEQIAGTNNHGLQVDLQLTTDQCQINDEKIAKIIQAIDLLTPFALPRVTEPIEDFKKDFIIKFGKNEVPLAIALDPEEGILFGGISGAGTLSPLTDDIFIEYPNIDKGHIRWTAADELLLDKCITALKNNKHVINFTDAELIDLKLKDKDVEFAESSYLMGAFVKEEDQEDKFLLKVLDGPASSKLLGRFCAYDEALTLEVRGLLQEEEQFNTDAIYAEVVYVPQSKIGNVLIRPHLRLFEITVIGSLSTLPSDKQIPTSDLTISVVNGQLVLKSISLNKRVIPRESSAYFPSNDDLPIYVFLSYLNADTYRHTMMFNWNEALQNRPFLPRIEFDQLILSPARWRISKVIVDNLLRNNSLPAPEKKILLTNHFNLPDVVVLKSGDQELIIDLNNELSFEILMDEIDKNAFVILEESFFYNKPSFVKSQINESYCHEVIIPLSYKTGQINAPLRDLQPSSFASNRHFLPGGEYLYLKVFLGQIYADQFLTVILKPLLQQYNEDFERFFFIRYNDQGNHLRLRFKNSLNPKALYRILSGFHVKFTSLFEQKLIFKYQVDVYEQEVSEYGASFIDLAEDIFAIDSDVVIELLCISKEHKPWPTESFLWIACKIVEDYFTWFNLTLDEKLNLTKDLSAGYFSEFNGSKSLKRQLDDRYRQYKEQMFDLIANNRINNLVPLVDKLFKEREEQIYPLFESIKLHADYSFDIRNRLLERFIHLFINRLFRSDQRKTELLVYHLMHKVYIALKRRTN